LFGLIADDLQEVKVDRAEYSGTFNGQSKNYFVDLQDVDIISNIIMKSSISFNRYSNIWKLGLLDIEKDDDIYKFRNDIEYQLYSSVKLAAGLELEKRISKYGGRIPDNDYDIRPDAQSKNINSKFSVLRLGSYLEVEINKLLGFSNSSLVFGSRVDYMPDQKISWFDPRINFSYRLNNNSTIKVGWGIYHQLPDPRLFSSDDGNPDLQAMKAIHYILSYDVNISEQKTLRVEIYHKEYKNLPLENEILNYDNRGYGYARGIDIIAKGSFPLGIDGWISYGFIDTKRKWMDFQDFAKSTYDITHNLSLIVKYSFSAMWQIGINYKYATGRPYTPIKDVLFHSEENVYEPIYGTTNSSRYPAYHRLDLRLTHFNSMFDKYFTVYYLEALNILNIANIFDYTYNKNYTQKEGVKSFFGQRTIVFGLGVTL
jgi:hypothetical protein